MQKETRNLSEVRHSKKSSTYIHEIFESEGLNSKQPQISLNCERFTCYDNLVNISHLSNAKATDYEDKEEENKWIRNLLFGAEKKIHRGAT